MSKIDNILKASMEADVVDVDAAVEFESSPNEFVELSGIAIAGNELEQHNVAMECLLNASVALEALLTLPSDSEMYRISHESILLTLGLESDEAPTTEKSKGMLRSIMDGISSFFKKLWAMITGFFGKIKAFFTGQNKRIDSTIEAIKAEESKPEDLRSNVGGGSSGGSNASTGGNEDASRLEIHKLEVNIPGLFNVKGGVSADSLDSVYSQIDEVVSFGKAVVEQLERTHGLYDKVVVDLKGAAKSVEGTKFDAAVNSAIAKLNQHSIVESVFKHKGILAGGLKVEVATEHGATRISVETAPLGESVKIEAERRAVVEFLEKLKKLNESFITNVANRSDRLSTMTNRLIDVFDKTIEEVLAGGLQNRISSFRRVSHVLITIMRGDTQALTRVSQAAARLVAAATTMSAPRNHAVLQNKH